MITLHYRKPFLLFFCLSAFCKVQNPEIPKLFCPQCLLLSSYCMTLKHLNPLIQLFVVVSIHGVLHACHAKTFDNFNRLFASFG